MSNYWLDIQSFQQTQDLLSAINTLSIHIKLGLAGIPDPGRKDAAAQARETLVSFFEALDEVVQGIEGGQRKPLLGVDARLRHLAQNFVKARRDPDQYGSQLFQNTLSHARHLLYSDQPEDLKEVLRSLKEFRSMLEKHVSTDATRLLGEI